MRIVQVEKSASQIVKEPAMDRVFDQAEENSPNSELTMIAGQLDAWCIPR